VRVQPEGQQLDLALELGHAPQQVLALLPEGLGQRDDRLDEPALAIVGGWDVVHAERLRPHGCATRSKSDAVARLGGNGAHLARVRARGVTG
jgi:hypothetical protein